MEFTSSQQYIEFSEYVRCCSRHVLTEPHQRFLDTVVATAESRRFAVPAGTRLWRAQLGCDIHPETGELFPYGEQRMMPLSDRASEGRINPKGIPCLYTSTEENTAMAEIRPWVGSEVSLAQLVTTRDLSVVDCTLDLEHRRQLLFAEKSYSPGDREHIVWGDIGRAFSEPVTRTDDVAEYAPTQFIAEAFRHAGYDGIGYASRLGKGQTRAFFDPSVAQISACHVMRLEDISFAFGAAGLPYYVKKFL